MSNSFSQMFDEHVWDAMEPPPSKPVVPPDGFDEALYLQANVDVAAAVERQEVESGYYHYATQGWEEKRPLFPEGSEPRDKFVATRPASIDLAGDAPATEAHVDAMLVSPAGGIMVVGWMNDVVSPLDHIRITGSGWFYTFTVGSIVRFRRLDAEAAMGSSRLHPFGFLAFAFVDKALNVSRGCEVTVGTKSGGQSSTEIMPRQIDDVELRNIVLKYIGESEFFGNRQIEAMRSLDGLTGSQIVRQNLFISRNVVAGACVERFGQRTRPLRGSIVVCLYGKPEFLFIQNAMFGGCPGFEDYELIYVSNSPEMAERLLKEARAAQQVYGLPQTVVLLPGNAGFGAANNIAVSHAQSDRILIVNPDVFPRDRDWAQKHSTAVANLPSSQTKIFGVPLYYDDGTLMHGGMYFDADTGVSLDSGRVTQRQMLRVEHYGKGAPVWASQFTRPRPIQAVTGAFISMDRDWYESLGGFTENYVFGHYEDADLCLKSIEKGVAPWIHDIRLWHLEGKGSLRLPVHEGGSLVNRWLFTETWGDFLADGLLGAEPAHKLFQDPDAVAAPAESSADVKIGSGDEVDARVIVAPKSGRRSNGKSAS